MTGHPDAPATTAIPSALVLGDSIAFCRRSAGQRLDEAWPQVLDASGELRVRWVRNREASTCHEVLADARQLDNYVGGTRTWDVTLIQVGIVDCTPRPFGRRTERTLRRMPRRPASLIGRHRRRVMSLRRAIGAGPRPWVGVEDFARDVEQLVDTVLSYSGHAAFIEIAPPGDGLIAKVGAYGEQVERYNEALRELAARRPEASSIDALGSTDITQTLLPDGHHLTALGHRLIAERVLAALPGMLAPPA